jgi:LPS-assembly protein
MRKRGQLVQAAAFGLPQVRPVWRWSVRGIAALVLATALVSAPPRPLDAQPQIATLIANSISVDRSGRLTASGAVEVWFGQTRLTAERLVFDRRTDQIDLEGPIVLSDGPSRVVLADQAQLSPDMREGLLIGARFVLDQRLQITAARAERRSGARGARLETVAASSCNICEASPVPLWEIRAAEVQHDEVEERLHFRNAEFRFRGVPVLRLPNTNIPAPGVVRARGFLAPTIDANDALGARIALPWFLPLGPHRDLTLTPGLGTEGSASLGFRYRAAQAEGGVQVAGLVATDQTLPGMMRGYLRLNGAYRLGSDFRLMFDAIAVSDRRVLRDYGISRENRLTSQFMLERIRRDEAIRLRALGFQSLRVGDINSELPSHVVQGGWERRIGLGHTALGGEAILSLEALAYSRPSNADIVGRDAGHARARLGWQRQDTLAGGLRLRVAAQAEGMASRILDDSTYPDPVEQFRGQAMAELRWPLARVSASGARQVIEPVAQIIVGTTASAALPNDDHRMPELDGANLFALNRFSGFDGADTGSRLNFGIGFSHHDPAGWTVDVLAGRVLRLSPLPGFAPAHRQPLGAVNSDWFLGISAEVAGRLRTGLAVTADDTGTLSRGEAGLHWTGAYSTVSTRVLHVPLILEERRPEPLTAWTVDLTHSFAEGWTAGLGWDYDLSLNLFSSARAGLTFRNECLLVDAGLRQAFVGPYNPAPSTSFELRVQLLGLGGGGGASPGRACRT